jgi:hypothetical protein
VASIHVTEAGTPRNPVVTVTAWPAAPAIQRSMRLISTPTQLLGRRETLSDCEQRLQEIVCPVRTADCDCSTRSSIRSREQAFLVKTSGDLPLYHRMQHSDELRPPRILLAATGVGACVKQQQQQQQQLQQGSMHSMLVCQVPGFCSWHHRIAKLYHCPVKLSGNSPSVFCTTGGWSAARMQCEMRAQTLH